MTARSGTEKRRRQRLVGVRLSDVEWDILTDITESIGISRAQYLRRAVFGPSMEGLLTPQVDESGAVREATP